MFVSTPRFSFNRSALKLVNNLIGDADRYVISLEKLRCGATLIDTGLAAAGGFRAGEIVSEISQCGYGRAKITPVQYENKVLPSVFVTNDLPAQSILGSQYAGWHLNFEGFRADASGPGRALVKDSEDSFHNVLCEESDVAILLLETDEKPRENVVLEIAEKCRVSPVNLFLIVFSITSIAGSIQACAKVVEAGLVRLAEIGLDPALVRYAWGYAPVISFLSNPDEVKERIKASIRFGGVADYVVDSEDDHLGELVSKAHDSALRMLQEAKRLADKNPLYKDLLQESGADMLKIDPNVAAPATVTLRSLKSGRSFSSGEIDFAAVQRAIGIM